MQMRAHAVMCCGCFGIVFVWGGGHLRVWHVAFFRFGCARRVLVCLAARILVGTSSVCHCGASPPACPQVEKYLIMLLVKLTKYEENPQQRQGGLKATSAFARVDCSVILGEMHSFFECLPVKQDTKSPDNKVGCGSCSCGSLISWMGGGGLFPECAFVGDGDWPCFLSSPKPNRRCHACVACYHSLLNVPSPRRCFVPCMRLWPVPETSLWLPPRTFCGS